MKDYIVAIGSNAIDEYYRCDNWPVLGDKAIIEFIESRVGGMIPNAASVAANYGLSVYLLDVLGNDRYTQVIMEDLRSYNVRTNYISIEEKMENSKTHIILSKNDRTIFVLKDNKPKIQLNNEIKELLLNSRYIYTIISDMKKIHGHRDFVEELKKSRAGLVFDVESESFDSYKEDSFYFNNAEVLFFNENGFSKFIGKGNEKSILGELFCHGVKIIVKTLGANGCMIITEDDEISIPGRKVEVVDTTGAGDTFNASFMYGLMSNWNLKSTADFANAAAARSVQYFGPKGGIATVQEIENML